MTRAKQESLKLRKNIWDFSVRGGRQVWAKKGDIVRIVKREADGLLIELKDGRQTFVFNEEL